MLLSISDSFVQAQRDSLLSWGNPVGVGVSFGGLRFLARESETVLGGHMSLVIF